LLEAVIDYLCGFFGLHPKSRFKSLLKAIIKRFIHYIEMFQGPPPTPDVGRINIYHGPNPMLRQV
jgi:hypothetical protein